MKSVAFYDTAGSVKQLGGAAATAMRRQLPARPPHTFMAHSILAADIEDNPENFTRFFLVRRKCECSRRSRSNKISIAFSSKIAPGRWSPRFSELSAIGTNLTKIESRPVHGKPWEYIFYVDCQIHSADEGSRALAALNRIAPW